MKDYLDPMQAVNMRDLVLAELTININDIYNIDDSI